MTTEYRGQADVARWCGVGRAAVGNWMARHPSTHPQPDVIIRNEGTSSVTRGWLPERRAEWEAFAAARSSEPRSAKRQAASRARRTADMIVTDMQAGVITAEEAAKLLATLI